MTKKKFFKIECCAALAGKKFYFRGEHVYAKDARTDERIGRLWVSERVKELLEKIAEQYPAHDARRTQLVLDLIYDENRDPREFEVDEYDY